MCTVRSEKCTVHFVNCQCLPVLCTVDFNKCTVQFVNCQCLPVMCTVHFENCQCSPVMCTVDFNKCTVHFENFQCEYVMGMVPPVIFRWESVIIPQRVCSLICGLCSINCVCCVNLYCTQAQASRLSFSSLYNLVQQSLS